MFFEFAKIRNISAPRHPSFRWRSEGQCGAFRVRAAGGTLATNPYRYASPSRGASSRPPSASGRAGGAGVFRHSANTTTSRPVAGFSTCRPCSSAASRGKDWQLIRPSLAPYSLRAYPVRYRQGMLEVTASCPISCGWINPLDPSCWPVRHIADTG